MLLKDFVGLLQVDDESFKDFASSLSQTNQEAYCELMSVCLESKRDILYDTIQMFYSYNQLTEKNKWLLQESLPYLSFQAKDNIMLNVLDSPFFQDFFGEMRFNNAYHGKSFIDRYSNKHIYNNNMGEKQIETVQKMLIMVDSFDKKVNYNYTINLEHMIRYPFFGIKKFTEMLELPTNEIEYRILEFDGLHSNIKNILFPQKVSEEDFDFIFKLAFKENIVQHKVQNFSEYFLNMLSISLFSPMFVSDNLVFPDFNRSKKLFERITPLLSEKYKKDFNFKDFFEVHYVNSKEDTYFFEEVVSRTEQYFLSADSQPLSGRKRLKI